MTHPYINLDDRNFWSRSIVSPAAGHLDPVSNSIQIGLSEKISTMGSCFAQHLSKKIADSGFNYFIAEAPPPDINIEVAKRKNYGVFSARYGNIYTPKQALQLFDRSYGNFRSDHIWEKNNRFIDAFRPLVEPEGFESIEHLYNDRTNHLSCVRRIFEESDWIIFTLGLTEAWRSRSDGAIFPVAPGVAGGNFNEHDHEFVNFSIFEVITDLKDLFEKIFEVNPNVNIILTVSPVPLIATYENRHVLVSTTYSKSVLRVAADELERFFKNVIYFPSYEIITSYSNDGRYYENDFRQVTEDGVNHVMRVFSRHFLHPLNDLGSKDDVKNLPHLRESELVCDEEEIEKSIRQSGFRD